MKFFIKYKPIGSINEYHICLREDNLIIDYRNIYFNFIITVIDFIKQLNITELEQIDYDINSYDDSYYVYLIFKSDIKNTDEIIKNILKFLDENYIKKEWKSLMFPKLTEIIKTKLKKDYKFSMKSSLLSNFNEYELDRVFDILDNNNKI